MTDTVFIVGNSWDQNWNLWVVKQQVAPVVYCSKYTPHSGQNPKHLWECSILVPYPLHFLLVGPYHWSPALAFGCLQSWNESVFSDAAVTMTGADLPSPYLYNIKQLTYIQGFVAQSITLYLHYWQNIHILHYRVFYLLICVSGNALCDTQRYSTHQLQIMWNLKFLEWCTVR